jgi:hypothetical protein
MSTYVQGTALKHRRTSSSRRGPTDHIGSRLTAKNTRLRDDEEVARIADAEPELRALVVAYKNTLGRDARVQFGRGAFATPYRPKFRER